MSNGMWNIHQYLNYNVCRIIYQPLIEASQSIPSFQATTFNFSIIHLNGKGGLTFAGLTAVCLYLDLATNMYFFQICYINT